ncbi:MAG: orotidine 5'-phosphate decarboxylase [Candidatus Nitrosocosmicus sp.]|nr:orotidine 5'-phosphate decarboxylase [Candidatus Nitrosocosmicus sp.]MDN5868734.1 orotidine 5'-phosphate decarboxylase [Candidatus Nitrosocosmicus sp.]
MQKYGSFANRISEIKREKRSNIILAVDPTCEVENLSDYVCHIISQLHDYVCAIKLNFHVILPLSKIKLKKITQIAHDFNLQIIADLKLNDIFDTNQITIKCLSSLGFDSVIVNPFIGKISLKSTVDYAHSLNFGVISLVYMSHADAVEGYGASLAIPDGIDKSENSKPVYRIFYDNSKSVGVDGVVVGGNRLDILKELRSKDNDGLPIYSPGILTQGGDIKKALEAGSTYLIIGRAIVNSDSPLNRIKNIYDLIKDLEY